MRILDSATSSPQSTSSSCERPTLRRGRIGRCDCDGNDPDRPAAATDSATLKLLYGVAASGTRFVAVGTNGAIVHSNDGDRWKASGSATSNLLEGVTGNGTRFVAVGSNGTLVASP